ncbi:hypothetical protein, partial [Sinorhizobium meliloti]|uniref:hypothetical protein n=1 Tax=Rhizobium meliloti TaxID=382 RepID=UPI001AED0DEB
QAAAGQSKPTKTPDHPKPNGLPLYMNFPRTALPPAGRRCRQADEGRVTDNANVSAYGFDPKDPSASLATAGNTDAATPE